MRNGSTGRIAVISVASTIVATLVFRKFNVKAPGLTN